MNDIYRPDWRHFALFLAAFVSATFAGAGFGVAAADPWETPEALVQGLWYSIPVLTILFAHEMGHFLTAKRYGVEATPPFFIPGLPIPGGGVIPFIGTFGAFIRMNLTPLSASKLLSIGAWGPVAGFIVTVPVLVVGFALSEVQPLPIEEGGAITLGNSVLLWGLQELFHPNIPAGHDVFLHPLAMAGWVGSFLTALNLMPVGQLDGGHILYASVGEISFRITPVVFALMLVLGVAFFPGWLVIAFLVWMLGIRHPPVIEGGVAENRWLAYLCAAIFLVTFAPAPIEGMSLLDLVFE